MGEADKRVMFFSGLCNAVKHGVTAEFFCIIAVLSCFRSLLRVNVRHSQSCGRGTGFQLYLPGKTGHRN